MDFQTDFRMKIDGRLVAGDATIDVINPATGVAFAQAPDCAAAQLDQAVAAGRTAFVLWRKISVADRQALLRKAADCLNAHTEELARLFTREQGRPTHAAALEIQVAVAWLNAFSHMTPPVHVVEDNASQWVEMRHLPLGVVGAISPWNFPMGLSVWKLAPALVAANTLVLKPSPFTPLCVLKIGELFSDVFPAGVFNVVSGNDSLGPLITRHPGIAKLSFTGSTATGKRVMASAAQDLKRVILELGGQ